MRIKHIFDELLYPYDTIMKGIIAL